MTSARWSTRSSPGSPGRYRAAVVLCCLEGLTQQQAAQHLGWPLGTVQSRLARGRERLRVRLMRRGLAPSAWLPGAVFTTGACTTGDGCRAGGFDDSCRDPVRGRKDGGRDRPGLDRHPDGRSAQDHAHDQTRQACGHRVARGIHSRRRGGTGGGAGPVRCPGPTTHTDATVSPRPKPDDTKTEADALRRRQAELIAEVQSLKDELAKAKAAQGQPIFGMARAEGVVWEWEALEWAWEEGVVWEWEAPQATRGRQPPTVASAEIIAVPSSGGDKVWAQSLKGGAWKLYRVPKGVKATIILRGNVLALMMEGPEISQVVVFDSASEEWLPQDLREPVKGRVIPIIDQDLAVNNTGRFIYAFSALAKRWEVRELAEGPSSVQLYSNALPGHGRQPPACLQRRIGRWSHLDTEAENP